MDDSINCQDNKGNTALHRAITNNNNGELQKLLSHPEINVNVKNSNHATPLSLAITSNSKSSKDAMKYLLNHPAVDVNCYDDFNNTPLIYTVKNQKLEKIYFLLKHPNIDVNIPDMVGHSAWTIFLKEKIPDHDNQLLKLFLALPSLKVNETHQSTGFTMLMNIIHSGPNEDRVKLLLSRDDLDINKISTNGLCLTALMLAVKHHRIKILELLLKCPNIDVNQQDTKGNTALMFACGSLKVTQMLLNHQNTDIYLTSSDGKTAIQTLLSKSPVDEEILSALQSHPMYDINKLNEDGSTDLHWVIRQIWQKKQTNNDYSVQPFQLLLKHPNINVCLPDDCNDTALSLAAQYLDTNIMKLITGHASFNKENFNLQNNSGKTFLHLLCQSSVKCPDMDDEYLLKLLKDDAIDINIQDQKGYTAIMFLLDNKFTFVPDIVECLVNHPRKCDLTKRNIYDQTVLDIMELAGGEVDPRIQSLLKKHGGLKSMAYLSDVSIADQIKFLRKSINASPDLNADGKEYIQQQLNCLESDLEELTKGHIGSEFGMTKLHRDKLLGCRKYLLDNLSPHEILNHLFQDKIITTNNMEDILAIKSRYKVATKLLSILPMRGPNAYQSFITALNETSQEYIAEELEKLDPYANNDNHMQGNHQLGQVVPTGSGQLMQIGPGQASGVVVPVELPSSGAASLTLWFNTKN